MSATARMWASTHNDTVKERMSAAVSALSACQQKIGTGYLSAFPTELFDRVEAIKPVWAPYYTIHKVGSTSIKVLQDRHDLFGLKIVKQLAFNLSTLTDLGRPT
jgi:hypothetical protein